MQGLREAFAKAVGLHQSGRVAEAEGLYRQILQIDPRHCDALHMLGVLGLQFGRHEAAVQLIGQAIAQNGRVPAFHNNLGNALKGWGRPEEALAAYGRAVACAPDHAGAHYNLAVTLQELGRVAEAELSYRRSLAAQPDHPDARQNLGNLLAGRGDLEGATTCYHRVLALRPYHGKSLCGLGLLRLRLARSEEAASFCRRAVVAEPNFANAYVTLGAALKETARHAEAPGASRRAALLEPYSAEAQLALAMSVIPLAPESEAESRSAASRFMSALDGLEQWQGQLGGAIGLSQPFHLAYRPHDVTQPLLRYGHLAHEAASSFWQVPSWQKRTGGRIRLGIVSGQIRTHPVWDMLLKGILAHLDRERFELFLYHTGAIADSQTAWARSKSDRFIQGPMPVKGWIALLSEDRPDILFYPELGMDPASCALASLKLAPLQAASWGHPVTSGLPSVDLFFSGVLLEGEGADAHYRERLIRLPGTGICTEPAPAACKPWRGAGRGLKFALCQQPLKFDPAHDRLLARIARQAGDCEFWLAGSRTHDWASERLLKRLAGVFRAEGLDPDAHLRLFPWMDREGFNGFLDAMDVMLDCPAFSGYTTAWQALHRGLPIVTLEGEFLRQRLASGLLRQIGRAEGVCATEDAYVEAALNRPQRIPREAAFLANGNQAAVQALGESLISALG